MEQTGVALGPHCFTLADELEWLRPLLAASERYVAHWMEDPFLVKDFHRFGAVEVVRETNPKDIHIDDGRWAFDPANKVYHKSGWLLWPSLVGPRQDINLGNIIESLLGVREPIVAERKLLLLEDNPP